MDDSNAHIGDNNKGSAGDRSQGHTDTLMQAPGDTIMHMLAAITQSTEAQNTVTAPSPAPTHTDTQSHTITHSHTQSHTQAKSPSRHTCHTGSTRDAVSFLRGLLRPQVCPNSSPLLLCSLGPWAAGLWLSWGQGVGWQGVLCRSPQQPLCAART